jgi:hypothetical protein
MTHLIIKIEVSLKPIEVVFGNGDGDRSRGNVRGWGQVLKMGMGTKLCSWCNNGGRCPSPCFGLYGNALLHALSFRGSKLLQPAGRQCLLVRSINRPRKTPPKSKMMVFKWFLRSPEFPLQVEHNFFREKDVW